MIKWIRRHRLASSAIGVIVVLVVAQFVGAHVTGDKPSPAAQSSKHVVTNQFSTAEATTSQTSETSSASTPTDRPTATPTASQSGDSTAPSSTPQPTLTAQPSACDQGKSLDIVRCAASYDVGLAQAVFLPASQRNHAIEAIILPSQVDQAEGLYDEIANNVATSLQVSALELPGAYKLIVSVQHYRTESFDDADGQATVDLVSHTLIAQVDSQKPPIERCSKDPVILQAYNGRYYDTLAVSAKGMSVIDCSQAASQPGYQPYAPSVP